MEDGKNSRADICIFIISPAGRAVKKVGRWGGLKEVETNRHRAGLFLVFGLNKHTEHINSKRVVLVLSLEMPPHPDACSRQSHYHRGGVGGEEGQHHHHHLCVCTTAEVAVLERVGGAGRCCRSFDTPRRGPSHHPVKHGLAKFHCFCRKLQTCILNRDVSSANMQSEK